MGTGEWDKMLPESELLGKYFHEQFKVSPNHQRRRSEWKKGKSGKVFKSKEKRRSKPDPCSDVAALSGPPEVELPSNASSFAVFANVRLAVLDRWMKQACQIYLSSSSSAPPLDGGSERESDSEENTDRGRETAPLKVPKIVGVGLRSVFELIRESRSSHPLLCTKALKALLDVIQGQTPEGLKSEPTEVIGLYNSKIPCGDVPCSDPLFDLLLDLATSHGPESAAANDGSHLTAVACACLLSLVVVRGDTGKLLSATAALLMCPRALAAQNIHMPGVLTSIQRSVHGVLLGKVVRPDWITHGVPKTSCIDSFHVKIGTDTHSLSSSRSLASDGQYIYLYSSRGLYKVGSGYGGTIKGHIYLHRADFYIDDRGWLGFANATLYFKAVSKKGCELLAVDRDSFKVTEVVSLEGRDWGSTVMFSDGDNLGLITSAKDDGFVVRSLNPGTNPMVSGSELPLKLARKCVDVFGTSLFDDDSSIHTLHTGCDEETAFITAGKDFGLIRTGSGKVLYCGKSSSLGIKAGGLRAGKWAELPITKSPKISHVAVGHEGLHAVLVAEDGSVFFVGTARRGEDGDQNKARRQPKPLKPKKILKVDGQHIVFAACNNGTTALVNKEGELVMYGKDTTHCDNLTGVVTELREVNVTQVALGKAHAIVLTNKGHIYTFGINNKGQCGRDFAAPVKEVLEYKKRQYFPSITFAKYDWVHNPYAESPESSTDLLVEKVEHRPELHTPSKPQTSPVESHWYRYRSITTGDLHLVTIPVGLNVVTLSVRLCSVAMVVAMETAGEEEGEGEELDWEDAQEAMCQPGKHKWKHDLCMVCTVCRECTGYSISCLSSMRPDRNPGQECGCGEGDSGCAECGCCRICAREGVDNSELAILGPSGAGDLAGMMRLDLIFAGEKQSQYYRWALVTFNAGNYIRGRCCLTCLPLTSCRSSSDESLSSGPSATSPSLEEVSDPTAGRHGARLQDHLQRRLDERKLRVRGKGVGGPSKHSLLKMKGSNNSRAAGPSTGPVVAVKSPVFKAVPPAMPAAANILVEEQAGGSDAERDASRVTSLLPARVHTPTESPVVQVSCGLHHTILLLHSGEVLTFGSNTYGQLGLGDLLPRGGPTLVRLPCHAISVAAGGNHSVVLGAKGEVFTFGSYQKGQLGRPLQSSAQDSQSSSGSTGGQKKDGRSSREGPWYSYPGVVPNIGPRYGRRATWVGASGDQTFLKIDESLINSLSLTRSTVMANKNCIVLLPTQSDSAGSFKCLAISKRDGNCNSFSGPDQVEFSHTATCLDPLYNVLWSYHPGSHTMSCYNVVACEAADSLPPSVLSPEMALPVVPGCFVTRSQAALHLLSCLDTLTQAQELRIVVQEESEERPQGCGKVYSREDFSAVTRFESHGGGWGYSGHSIEAIRFMADTDILLGGFGLFGGRGEYTGKIKLFDIGMDGGEQETDGEMLAETEEVPYECGPRQKYPMLFEEPISLHANRWYVAWARVSGPSSDCGSSGQGMVTTEDQVVFYFKSSKKSNNGTDVNAGQIPQILYRVVSPENQTPSRQCDQAEPVYILSRDFSRAVSKECFQSLLALLQWSWNTFKAGLVDISHLSSSTSSHLVALLDLERLVYISRASLRLVQTYTNELYPNQVGSKKSLSESVLLAECVGDVRALLRQILSDLLPAAHTTRRSGKIRPQKNVLTFPCGPGGVPYQKMTQSILEECHQTFVSCFHAFYPTAFLKWTCLCDLLALMDKNNYDRLLSAVLAALCSPTVRLRSTFPILTSMLDASDSSLKRQLSPSDNTGLPMMPCVDSHHYPILVEQMSYRSQLEGNGAVGNWLFREVLERLLDLVTVPVKQALCQEKVSRSQELVHNCCHLLARIVAELATQSSGTDEDLQGACGRILHTTPSRFTRTNQSRTWNTGNGSPDAVCFSVDRPGIVVAGVCVYGGVGSYEYELELLDDQNNTGNDPSHTQRWNSLEIARGTFGPDDCVADVAEVKFERPVAIREGVKYAVRLRNHGGRTSNGDGGLGSVKGPDGVTFAFSTCSLSFNGTTQTRGQIPQILYYRIPRISRRARHGQSSRPASVPCPWLQPSCSAANDLMALARERAEDVVATEVLGSACIVTTLLPLMLAHISPLATLDPRSGVQVLNLIQELLPHVAALNLLNSGLHHSTGSLEGGANCGDNHGYCQPSASNTTSHHYAWVESDHPYKPATVSNYRASFPDTVKWLCVEFDPECGTAQAEDTLQLYIPSMAPRPSGGPDKKTGSGGVLLEEGDGDSTPVPYWPVLHKFSRGANNWPRNAVVLPGNEVIFSLETASDYIKEERSCFYGFRCLVVGYEWGLTPGDGLKHLETELAYLGGMCAASLMKKDLLLPPISVEEMDDDLDLLEELAQQVYNSHSALLGKGFALASPPTISQALEGILPFSKIADMYPLIFYMGDLQPIMICLDPATPLSLMGDARSLPGRDSD
uniref:PHR domain-containing protein n=1 Tax=Timema douglasi TaxID=61478 RepID=A0A7R8ZCY8_TIMDO|nr:unnamed protein product [Timema douglasi]